MHLCSSNCLVSVVIVNWNGRSWLETCLPTLANQTCTQFETIIVDNGSSDDSIPWLKSHWPQVHLIPLPHNTGFAVANNVAIRQTTAPFIATLNNDTLVEPAWLEALLAVANESNVGMVASQIRQWQQPDCLDSAGIDLDYAGIAWNRGWNLPVTQANTPTHVFGPSAAAALYRRTMLDEIGLFDEDFFAYYEDVDLAWRAQRAGWHCWYTPYAQVRHWHSATSSRTPKHKLFLLGRNKLWTLFKNLPTTAVWRQLPVILAYELLSLAYQTWQGQGLTAIYSRLAAVKQLRHTLAKRTPTHHPVPIAPLTPPWQHQTRPIPPLQKQMILYN